MYSQVDISRADSPASPHVLWSLIVYTEVNRATTVAPFHPRSYSQYPCYHASL